MDVGGDVRGGGGEKALVRESSMVTEAFFKRLVKGTRDILRKTVDERGGK